MPKRTSVARAYEARVNVAMPRPLSVAVANAADRQLTSVNAYIRSAVLAKLQSDGIEVSESAAPAKLIEAELAKPCAPRARRESAARPKV
jgi:hypothetical protein